MPNHKSAEKRIKTSLKQKKYNTYYKSTLRTTIKSLLKVTEKEEASAKLIETYSLLDKLVKKNIIHQNKAANQKARLAKHVNSL